MNDQARETLEARAGELERVRAAKGIKPIAGVHEAVALPSRRGAQPFAGVSLHGTSLAPWAGTTCPVRRRLLILLGGVCLASGAIAEPPAPGVIPDFATAVAVDRSDDAVVTGLHMRRPGAEPGCDFFAAKLRHDTGVVAWRTQFPDCEIDEALGPANGEQVFLDAGGDVVVAKRVPPRAFPPRRPRDVPRRTKSMAQAHHWT